MSAPGFSVRFVESEAQVDPQLWEACFPPPLEGRWWYATLEQCGLEDQFSFLYGVIHRDGVPVGVAPVFVMDFPVALVAPPALLRAVQEAQFEQLKNQLLRERLATVPDPELSRDVSRAAGEAAALAWVTPYPLLVFPVLFAEKAETALVRAAKQEQVCQSSRELLAI